MYLTRKKYNHSRINITYMAALKTAILGLKDGGELLLEATAKCGYFTVTAVADKDTALVEKTAQTYNCTAYDDYRQLIMQNDFDCVLVAAGMHSCEEYLRAAIKKKMNILKLPPPARNFEEIEEFAKLAHRENINFAVANTKRFSRSFTAAKEFIEAGKLEQIFLITAVSTNGNNAYPPWYSDPKLAGGGVLLRNGYQILDQMLCLFSIPQQVYCLTGNHALDRQQRLCLTEDTAVLTMKFSDTLTANLTISRIFGAKEETIKIHGKNKILTIADNYFGISDNRGNIISEQRYNQTEFDLITKLLEDFANSLINTQENKLNSSIHENRKNMAVIESAYLSARTGMPESSDRILKTTI